jgi:type II secretory pathway component GspD/PulD (secretin)
LLLASLAVVLPPALAAGGEAKSPDPEPAAAAPADAPEAAKPSEAPPALKPASPASADAEKEVVRIYSLRYADGQTVASTIQQTAPEARLTTDLRGNRLIVIGPPSAHERVAEVLETLDVPPGDEQEDRSIMAYSLRHMDGEMALSVIEEAVPLANMKVDEASNRLIVWATPADHQRVREFIERLDVPPARDHEQAQLFESYQLRHILAASAVELLAGMLPESPGLRMAANEQTNTMIVLAPSEVQKQVEALLERLDVPVDPLKDIQIKVFSLIHADAGTLAEMISTLFDGEDVKISFDPKANAIVATGPERALEVIEALLLRMDTDQHRETPKTSSATFQVRVVWLVSGLEGGQMAPPADDLNVVVHELHDLGVTGLRQGAQALVNTTPGGEFHVSCAPMLDQGPTDVRICGSLELKEDVPVLDIEITGTLVHSVPLRRSSGEKRPEQLVQRGDLANLATKIAAPLGQYVVLGVTPAKDLTSVFVVQVTSK